MNPYTQMKETLTTYGWTKYTLGDVDEGFCLVGAMYRVVGQDAVKTAGELTLAKMKTTRLHMFEVYEDLNLVICQLYPHIGMESIEEFNDSFYTSERMIFRVLDAAEKRWDKKHQTPPTTVDDKITSQDLQWLENQPVPELAS